MQGQYIPKPKIPGSGLVTRWQVVRTQILQAANLMTPASKANCFSSQVAEDKIITQSLLQELPMRHCPKPHNGSQPCCKDSDDKGVPSTYKPMAPEDIKVEALKLRELRVGCTLQPVSKNLESASLRTTAKGYFHMEQTGSKQTGILEEIALSKKTKA